MNNTVSVVISSEDDYLVKHLFNNKRALKAFNNRLRGISVPVGDFHGKLHDQVVYDTTHADRSMISHLSNLYLVREPKYKASVLELKHCYDRDCIVAVMDWSEEIDPPDELRVTAIMKGRNCLRVLQFGIL